MAQFKISSGASLYNDKIEIKRLKKIGFTFEKYYGYFIIDGEPTIEINTLDELISFTKEYGDIILTEGYITIFKGYE